ncbi:MAG: hypothetical protein ACFHVJ_12360 [Aestuariibacter sp.]
MVESELYILTEKKIKQQEKSKGDEFTSAIPNGIWMEEESEENPYLAEKSYLYGYNFEELVKAKSYVEMLFLMLKGDLPNAQQSRLLEFLLKAFITPGIRHPATRAAMNAGIGRTEISHILPIGLQVLSSDYLGSKEVANCMQFLEKSIEKSPLEIVRKVECESNKPNPIPGFGTIYNGFDILTQNLANHIDDTGLPYVKWANEFVALLNLHQPGKLSWLPTGLAATIMCDLGLNYRIGCGLFQILQAPGLMMHGVEKANKALTEMPFISEDKYVITT